MYTLAVQRAFVARHFLTGGDWGPENFLHAHDYRLELEVEAEALDAHGYCVDIVAVEAALDGIVARFAGAVLNEDPDFVGLNPSIEHFARIIWNALAGQIVAPNLTALTIHIWESDIARASYRRPFVRPSI